MQTFKVYCGYKLKYVEKEECEDCKLNDPEECEDSFLYIEDDEEECEQ
jgi:putative hemolysin